jgi:SAM-dependent methyltransferase
MTESAGYRTDSRYPATCFRELSPVWLNYAAALNRCAAPRLDRPFTYLELGCGRAGSSLIHAAALPQGEFHACDFNHSALQEATARASLYGVANLTLHASTFAELARRDLPQFDYIVAHGVYSWVSDAARADLRAIVAHRLAPGGIVYLSYNCEPGWSAEAPLRRLLVELTRGSDAQTARDTLAGMRAVGFQYFRTHPAAAAAVDAYLRSPLDYFEHEFLNETWQTFWSVDVADEMHTLGLELIGSATLADNHAALIMDAAAAQAIAALGDVRSQQLAMDFAVNRQFRRDLFAHPAQVDAGALAACLVGAIDEPASLNATVRVPRGQLTFQEDFVEAVRGVAAEGALPIADWLARLGGPGRSVGELGRNLHFLIAAGELSPFASRASIREGPLEFANPVVERMIEALADGGEAGKIAAPALGGGVDVSPAEAATVLERVRRGQSASPALLARYRRLGLLDGSDAPP